MNGLLLSWYLDQPVPKLFCFFPLGAGVANTGPPAALDYNSYQPQQMAMDDGSCSPNIQGDHTTASPALEESAFMVYLGSEETTTPTPNMLYLFSGSWFVSQFWLKSKQMLPTSVLLFPSRVKASTAYLLPRLLPLFHRKAEYDHGYQLKLIPIYQ